MTDTPHLGMPLIAASQSQKHVTHNQAIVILDAIVMLSVIDSTHTAPPGSPAEGDRYKVGSAATGAWAAWDLNVALYTNGQWLKLTPKKGWTCFDEATGALTVWTGSGWTDIAAAGGYLTVAATGNGTLTKLGILTAADNTNRLAVKSNAALFSHDDVTPGTGDMRIALNKSAAAKDAAFVFQNGFSTRALFGLLADDNFTVKVSPDGSTFYTGMSIDKSSGKVSFPALAKVSAYINYDHYAATTYVNTDINNEDLDTANAFASNVFTAPTSGLYKVGYSLGWTQNGTNAPTSMHGRLLKNGATEVLPSASRASNNAADTGKIIICTEGIISLTAGDTLRLQHKFSSLDGYASANITRFWVEQLT
ncbi:MAG: DUF2793 domain-containing protein [Rhizobiales bacterium]|nr:DUF2793 domain-containing protein [Hyphomicrobiales bacterium]